MSKFFPLLKLAASYGAAFGGLASAAAFAAMGDTAHATTALLAALAGFGINLPPSRQ